MSQPLTKRVTMIELFYDLVFAYMISQATGLIHHLHHGIISPISFLIFAVVVIVFTNRYGSSSWLDIIFYFIDMMILLFMTNSFGETSSKNMTIFFLAASLLSFTLLLQYLIVYFRSKSQVDKNIAKSFSEILIFRTITLLIIITFGETIIGIADYFKPSDFSINSIFIFIIVAALFFAYIC